MSGQGQWDDVDNYPSFEIWADKSLFCVGRDKGGGKTKGGGGSIKITKTKERKTKDLDEKIIHLRKAVFAENGKDKDVTIGIAPAFLKFDRNGLNVEIAFSPRLTEDEEDWAFDIIKSNMEEVCRWIAHSS